MGGGAKASSPKADGDEDNISETGMTRQSTSTSKDSSDFSDLKADIDKLRADMSALTKHMKDIGGSAVTEAQKAGADKVGELRDELERTAEQLKKQGAASVAEVEKTVQDKPLLSLLAAFGVGMLVTRLLDRN